jgi:transposase
MPEAIAHPGRPLKPIELTPNERTELARLARRQKSAQHLALRARIVLACARGLSNGDVAEELGVDRVTVGKWRERFRVHRLQGLHDEARAGAPRQVSDDAVEDVVVRTLESTPKGQTHWSRATMAKAAGVSESTVGRIWRAFGLKPHLTETFKLSPDPLFVDKVRDIVGLYLSPPANAVVLCVDEKSQIQALNRTQPILPLRPGQPERRSHDYQRNGVTSLFAALDAHRGDVIWKTYRSHRHQEFLRFLRQIEESLPIDLEVHLILDNYATHKTPAVQRWLNKRPRFHVHFTPTYSSWLNLVERLFAEVTDKAIRRGSHNSVVALEKAIGEYLRQREPKPFVWTASADAIFSSIKRFCERTSGGGH